MQFSFPKRYFNPVDAVTPHTYPEISAFMSVYLANQLEVSVREKKILHDLTFGNFYRNLLWFYTILVQTGLDAARKVSIMQIYHRQIN